MWELLDLRQVASAVAELRRGLGGVQILKGYRHPGRALVVLAHADDHSLAAAGIYLSAPYSDTWGATACCVPRRGVPTRAGALQELIALGAEVAILGQAKDLRGPDPDDRSEVVELLSVLREAKPEVVVTHHGRIDPHPAHRATFEMVRRTIAMLDPIEKPSQLLLTRPPANHEGVFRPDVVVGFSPGLALLKASLIELHETESSRAYYRREDVLSLMSTTSAVLDPFARRPSPALFAESFEQDPVP